MLKKVMCAVLFGAVMTNVFADGSPAQPQPQWKAPGHSVTTVLTRK